VSINQQAADELLTTTRAVRKRLDLNRPVPREVILDCIRVSQQAPTGSNSQGWRWVIVTDAAKKRALADLYRSVATGYFVQASAAAKESGSAQTSRVFDSASYLNDHMQDMPALVIPCLMGRPAEGGGVAGSGGFFASIYPAVWNFCLALRARGLGSALTTLQRPRPSSASRTTSPRRRCCRWAIRSVWTSSRPTVRRRRPSPPGTSGMRIRACPRKSENRLSARSAL
jgi:nitroreductase